VAFTPYATIKDMFGVSCFLIFFAWFIFYMPNYLGDADNYIPANPGVTPAHIVPEWYYLPFYAILRSIPNKLAGVIAMFSAIIVLAFLPWLDNAKTRSSKYRPLAKQFFWIFVAVCIGLGYLGAQPPEGIYVYAGRTLTICYFAYFLVLLPLLSRIEKPRPVPNSIADDVLAKTGSKSTPMVSTVIALLVAGGLLVGGAQNARAEEHQDTPPSQKWSFSGPFGKYDRGSLQRGLKVYKEVCSACHSLNYIAFRNLADQGGPGYSAAQAAAFASDYKIKDGPNDQGDMFERPGRPADYFPAPFPNEQAARAANGGAAPPDLSLITKARSYKRGFPTFIFDFFTQFQEQGPDYVDAILQGFEEKPPAGFALPAGSYYNKYFPGHAIKMPKPLSDGQVTYDDGSPATLAQYSHDVTTFLMWAAEPHMEARKRLGLQVFVFLILFAGLMYFTKKKVWANAH
jgi:ubiquinol-cytochrome c reductase cytochrome b/c1 subunit